MLPVDKHLSVDLISLEIKCGNLDCSVCASGGLCSCSPLIFLWGKKGCGGIGKLKYLFSWIWQIWTNISTT